MRFRRVWKGGGVWEGLGRFGRVWEGLAGYNGAPKCLVQLAPRMIGTTGPPNVWYNCAPACLVQLGPRMVSRRIRKGSRGFTKVWTVWEDFEGFGRVWEGFGRFGRVWDGVEGLGWFGRVWAGLGKFGEV